MAVNEDKHITVQAWLKYFCFCSDSITLLIGKKILLKKKLQHFLINFFNLIERALLLKQIISKHHKKQRKIPKVALVKADRMILGSDPSVELHRAHIIWSKFNVEPKVLIVHLKVTNARIDEHPIKEIITLEKSI